MDRSGGKSKWLGRYIAREREVDRMRWKSGVAQKKLERKKKNVFIIVILHYCWYHNKYASGISTTRKKSRTTKEKLLSNQERKIERIKQLWNRVKQMSRNFSTDSAHRSSCICVFVWGACWFSCFGAVFHPSEDYKSRRKRPNEKLFVPFFFELIKLHYFFFCVCVRHTKMFHFTFNNTLAVGLNTSANQNTHYD